MSIKETKVVKTIKTWFFYFFSWEAKGFVIAKKKEQEFLIENPKNKNKNSISKSNNKQYIDVYNVNFNWGFGAFRYFFASDFFNFNKYIIACTLRISFT